MQGLSIKLAIIPIAMMLCLCQAITNLHPLILVPGSGGNQLEARLTTGYKPLDLFCDRWYPISKDKEGWFRLWFDPSVLLAPFTKCFAQRMMLCYDRDLDDYRNAPGVETRVPEFGSTESLLYLDPHLKQLTAYMAQLIESLEEIGYVSGETLFGAPYDFRYGLAAEGHPSHVGSKFLQDLKDLIEKASASNGGKPVILLSHSLGGLYVLQLLNRNSASWRQRFIKHFVALSAPWGGTVQEMLTFASGSSFGVPLVDPLLVRGEQRSSESNLWLMPSPTLFGPGKVLVFTPSEAYSAHDIPQFLNDIGFPEGVIPYKSRILPLTEELRPPNVSVTCIIGTGVKTAETLFYGKAGFDEQPEVVYGDGDGTVNLVSLLALESLWANEKSQPLKVIRIAGISHTSILEDNAALDQIIGEVSSINSQAEVHFA
ncbi:PREDICTED: lecithin-cholesterol acyltransferase-like 1 [Theobroma cacao]|uniref:Lecithin-cholesterol acyltransferase-like 1 n=1 Tax=Theobroma cacao TaxID=3641 RepID=A0AB32UVF4_THECC|nr:PREDICTED: lecithin-cholesterol acyltransferase-like 1 [Theobroma cacao]